MIDIMIKTHMRVRLVPGSELPYTLACKRTFGIASLAGEAACTGSEDGRFASRESGRRHEEDKFEARGGHWDTGGRQRR